MTMTIIADLEILSTIETEKVPINSAFFVHSLRDTVWLPHERCSLNNFHLCSICVLRCTYYTTTVLKNQRFPADFLRQIHLSGMKKAHHSLQPFPAKSNVLLSLLMSPKGFPISSSRGFPADSASPLTHPFSSLPVMLRHLQNAAAPEAALS